MKRDRRDLIAERAGIRDPGLIAGLDRGSRLMVAHARVHRSCLKCRAARAAADAINREIDP